jgi:hypothetical protein
VLSFALIQHTDSKLLNTTKQGRNALMIVLGSISLVTARIASKLEQRTRVQQMTFHFRPVAIQLVRRAFQSTGCLRSRALELVLLRLIVGIILVSNTAAKFSFLKEVMM